MSTSKKEIFNNLFRIADKQCGYFTAKQAISAGYVDEVHNYHVKNGDWEKAYRGIYRLAEHPKSEWADFIIWSLWSRGREDIPQGVFSHETALEIHGFIDKKCKNKGTGDFMTSGTALGTGDLEEEEKGTGIFQMTVPRSFRKNCEIPAQLQLFKGDLPDADIEKREGYFVTTLDRTVKDLKSTSADPAVLKAVEAAEGSLRSHRFEHLVEYWDGPVFESRWSAGQSFEEALKAGED